MKDIKLTPSENGHYDWTLSDNDFEIVNGQEGIRNKIVHAVLLHHDELDTPLYTGKGSFLHEYVHMADTPSNTKFIQNSIQSVVNSIDGIISSDVTVEITGEQVAITNIRIMKTDGVEVDIGAI